MLQCSIGKKTVVDIISRNANDGISSERGIEHKSRLCFDNRALVRHLEYCADYLKKDINVLKVVYKKVFFLRTMSPQGE